LKFRISEKKKIGIAFFLFFFFLFSRQSCAWKYNFYCTSPFHECICINIYINMQIWKGLVGLLCPQGWADNIFCKQPCRSSECWKQSDEWIGKANWDLHFFFSSCMKKWLTRSKLTFMDLHLAHMMKIIMQMICFINYK
jgi:hypothetical protein